MDEGDYNRHSKRTNFGVPPMRYTPDDGVSHRPRVMSTPGEPQFSQPMSSTPKSGKIGKTVMGSVRSHRSSPSSNKSIRAAMMKHTEAVLRIETEIAELEEQHEDKERQLRKLELKISEEEELITGLTQESKIQTAEKVLHNLRSEVSNLRIDIEFGAKSLQRRKALLERKLDLEKAMIEEENESSDGSSVSFLTDIESQKSEGIQEWINTVPGVKVLRESLTQLEETTTPPLVKSKIPKNEEMPLTKENPEKFPQAGSKAIPIDSGEDLVKRFKKLREYAKATGGNIPVTTVKQSVVEPVVQSQDKVEKFMARQSIKQDLPPFEGNVEEWPIFISQYRSTTELCGLSNGENLHRLQKCLKGKARECVRALLTSPDNVTSILTVLEKRFGKPKVILEALILQVRKISYLKDGNYGGFLDYVDAVRNLTTTAKSLNCQPYLSNPQLLSDLVDRLSNGQQMMWAKKLKSLNKIFPDLTDLSNWLEEVSEEVDMIYHPSLNKNQDKLKPENDRKPKGKQPQGERVFLSADEEKEVSAKASEDLGSSRRQNSVSTTKDRGKLDSKRPNKQTKSKVCIVCAAPGHKITQCKKFTEDSVEDRWKLVRQKKLCFSCLNFGHSVAECRSKKPCGQDGCEKYHHPLIHILNVIPLESGVQVMAHVQIQQSELRAQFFYQVLPVILRGPKGEISTHAMLDTGAAYTLVDADLANTIGLSGVKCPFQFQGLGGSMRVVESNLVEIDVISKTGSQFHLKNVRTFKELDLGCRSLKQKTLQTWKHLQGLGLEVCQDVRPKILIGQSHADLLVPVRRIDGPPNSPIAAETKLGWVLSGYIPPTLEAPVIEPLFFFNESGEDYLHQMVKRNFSLEDFGVKLINEKPRSRENQRAQEIMDSTIKRVGSQWESGLLWKSDQVDLPKSKRYAMIRLMSMERKMDRDPLFSEKYCKKIQEYQDKGFARILTSEEAACVGQRTFYLPHFMAYNPKKPNKLRFVFDAAARVNGVGLNDMLLKGPDKLCPLPSVLFKFRQRGIGITADIKDMFHRVRIRKEDLSAQRFLWRGVDRNREPDVWEMGVMIFGAACSPTCAQEVKNKNALEFSEEFPEAVKAIVERHYVDDYLDSCESVDEAITRFRQVREIHERGGFNLCNWASNSREFLNAVPGVLRAAGIQNMDSGTEMGTERVLGLFWNPEADIFTFALNFLRVKEDVISGERFPTKREALALVMSVFDPLGFLAHFNVRAKIILQETWRSKIGWDDDLPKQVHGKWMNWLTQLKAISTFELARCYSPILSTAESIQLHIFCDASEQAFGAVAYYRISKNNQVEVSFITAKSRVAPLKPLTIPRLELQAALMGARLAKCIKEEHEVNPEQTFYWSDSTTVLCWLRSEGKRFQQFVSSRVGEIQELTDPLQWKWVPTKENVADELTRDNDLCEWSIRSRWLNGPSYLRLSEIEWPIEPVRSTLAENEKIELEYKKDYIGFAIFMEPLLDINRFTWVKLIRITAYVLRFAQNCRSSEKRNWETSMDLTPSDLKRSEQYWWKICQADTFSEEVRMLREQKPLSKTSRLLTVSPILDENGILRVDGRIKEIVGVGKFVKRPVILDGKHALTRLLVSHHHERANHHGQERMVNELRQLYYIPSIRMAVRSAWSRCQQCKNARAQPIVPLMGQLPKCRLNHWVTPFTSTGMDYFGPMLVTVGRRHEKRYGVLFTCLTTRAVHVEVAHSLSTDSCILAIRRFVNRRGCPTEMYSDNGTNFKGPITS